jgi:UDP-N-acetylglucosamine 2-epimerase (non-hydrolysing)
MKILSVVGARPNFMKIAPFLRAIHDYNSSRQSSVVCHQSEKIDHILVHTGQHYDRNMSDKFFSSLGMPDPDINLGVGSGSHAEQVGQTMIELEKVFLDQKPDWVVVVGDVNATLAASITAKKLLIKVAHIEAGLRSGDLTMPEEINRLVTDRLSDLLLVPDQLSGDNLRKEGVQEEKIIFVGNIMIDTLEAHREEAAALEIEEIIQKNKNPNSKHQIPNKFENSKLKTQNSVRQLADQTQNSELRTQNYAVVTLHRPSNVDIESVFRPILDFLIDEVAAEMPLIWPIHPRAMKQIQSFGLWDRICSQPNMILLQPIDYLEMLRLNMTAQVMLTDSGGLQEECTILGTPCLTLRWNTERPVTLVEHKGASMLVGNNIENIRKAYATALSMGRHPHRPELWDGHTAERCLQAILAI